MAPPPEDRPAQPDRRQIDLIKDHDDLVEVKFKMASLSEVKVDHEERLRDLELTRIPKIEGQQNEWKGALKTWGIFLLLVELFLNILIYYKK